VERLVAFMIYPPQFVQRNFNPVHSPSAIDLKRERLIHTYRAQDFDKTFLAFVRTKKRGKGVSPEELDLAADFEAFLDFGGVRELTLCSRRRWLNRYAPMRAWREWLTIFRGIEYALGLRDRPTFPRDKFVRSLAWWMALTPEYPAYPIASRPRSVKIAFNRHFAVMHLIYAYITVTGGPRMAPDTISTMIKNLNGYLDRCLGTAIAIKEVFTEIDLPRPTYAIMPRADLLRLPKSISNSGPILSVPAISQKDWKYATEFNPLEFFALSHLDPSASVTKAWDSRRWRFKGGRAH
jgi:hypothetical protein